MEECFLQTKRIVRLLAATLLVTAVYVSPARAKHDQDNEDEPHGDDWHHKHKEHHKRWHEDERHGCTPPPVVYAPPPAYYPPPPPVVYAPASINVVIPLPLP